MFTKGRKIGITACIIIAVICGACVLVNKNGIVRTPMLLSNIGRNRIGEGTEQEGSGAFSSSSTSLVGQAVDTSNWDLTRVNVVLDTGNIPVPVPKGFTASNVTGEHTVNTGFVIYEGEGAINDDNAWQESCTRNQFVWVPVPDPTRIYEEIGNTGKKKAKLWSFGGSIRNKITNDNTNSRSEPGILTNCDNKRYLTKYDLQGYTGERLYQELSTMFESDMDSINKYGGFYIGRYETGNIASEQPVVQRMNNDISNQTWYRMYLRTKKISTNENIRVSMIWGCLWDETLQWFIDTGDKTYLEVGNDLTEWGNYNNATFEYTNISGTLSTKKTNTKTKIPTGSTDRNKANNIYDMAGNVFDWTLEGNDNRSRCMRGGCYSNKGNDNPVLYRVEFEPYLYYDYYGFRVHACIK